MIEQLRFQHQQPHQDSHEDTSIKKCTGKYYEYHDRDLARPRLNASLCDQLNYHKVVFNKKGLNTSMKCVKTKAKKSQESEPTIRDSKCKNSMSLNLAGTGSRTTKRVGVSRDYTKPNSSRDELKYYKKICAEMRKKNEQLESQVQKKTTENKQNIRNLENKLRNIGQQVDSKMQSLSKHKYQDLVEQVTSINQKLCKKELKNEKYRKFFASMVESLELLGFEKEHPETKDVWRIWKQIVHYLISQKYQIQR